MAMRIDREALGRAGRTLRTFAAKYRIAILAALLGLLLLLWPTGSRRETVKTETAASGFSLAETEEKLEALLGKIDDAYAILVSVAKLLRSTDRNIILRHWLGDPETIDTVRAWLNYFDEKLGSGLMKKIAGMIKRA